MTLLIYEIAYGDQGKGREMKKEHVEVEVHDHHELELYRKLMKRKYEVPFLVLKYRGLKK